MHVVRHDDITSNCDVEINRTLSKLNESKMGSLRGEAPVYGDACKR